MAVDLAEKKPAVMPEHVDILNALGQPSRLRIIRLLSLNSELTGDEIRTLNADLKQPTIAHHMAILARAQLVETRRDGLRKFYRVNQQTIEYVRVFLAGL